MQKGITKIKLSNKIAQNPVGRPAKYRDPLVLAQKCNDYFKECEEQVRPYTVVGLALYLGFTCRQSVFEIKKRRKFFDTITRALARIEQQRNEMLVDPNNRNSRGSIFDLQNNFGWRDKQEVQLSGQIDARMAVIPVFATVEDWAKAWVKYGEPQNGQKQLPRKK